jgi:hypothetical protein
MQKQDFEEHSRDRLFSVLFHPCISDFLTESSGFADRHIPSPNHVRGSVDIVKNICMIMSRHDGLIVHDDLLALHFSEKN